MSLLRAFAALAALSWSISGCGANVVFGEDGSEGGGGNGTGGNGGVPTTGPNAGPNTATQGGGPPNTVTTNTGPGFACESFCALHADCLGGDDCMQTCSSLYEDGCELEADALIQCFTGILDDNCQPPPDACQQQGFAYEECVNGTPQVCFTESCEAGDDFCSCRGPCFGVELLQECFEQGPGGDGAFCNCFADGEFIGSCDTFGDICSIEEGCCQSLLFDGDGDGT